MVAEGPHSTTSLNIPTMNLGDLWRNDYGLERHVGEEGVPKAFTTSFLCSIVFNGDQALLISCSSQPLQFITRASPPLSS